MVGGAEAVLDGLAAMLTAELPELIAAVNARHADGMAIELPRTVTVLGTPSRALPRLALSLCEAAVTEKDRIIETEVYGIKIALHLCERKHVAERMKLRYMEALREFFFAHEWCALWESARVTSYGTESMTVRVER